MTTSVVPFARAGLLLLALASIPRLAQAQIGET
jgi:hypothetical protein